MRRFFAISSIGKDRPGIVAGVSKVLYDLGVNIEDSSMTILRSEFSMILLVSTNKDLNAADFEVELSKVAEEKGLFISVKEIKEHEVYSKKPYTGVPHMISVIGTDKPGIVHRIAEFLSSKEINITDLKTKVVSGEETPVYTMVLEVDVPLHLDISELEEGFSIIEKEMGIDINIREIEVLEL